MLALAGTLLIAGSCSQGVEFAALDCSQAEYDTEELLEAAYRAAGVDYRPREVYEARKSQRGQPVCERVGVDYDFVLRDRTFSVSIAEVDTAENAKRLLEDNSGQWEDGFGDASSEGPAPKSLRNAVTAAQGSPNESYAFCSADPEFTCNAGRVMENYVVTVSTLERNRSALTVQDLSLPEQAISALSRIILSIEHELLPTP
ncbi:MAG: hypothetical protein ACE367_15555 [Acidimicrobiales bacterium]